MDRAGTIFGTFVPNFGNVFIGTGSSIWGELHQMNLIKVNVLSLIKSNWITIYAFCYMSIFLTFLKFRNKLVVNDPRNKFILINLIYVIIVVPFLFLYPQTVDHRFLNFIIPLFFICFMMDMDVNILGIFSLMVILASDIYNKGALFHFNNISLFIATLLWLALFICFFAVTTNRRNIFISVISLMTFCAVFYLGNSSLHFNLFLVNYIVLFIWIAYLTLIYFKKNEAIKC